jgi:hypothetical protein
MKATISAMALAAFAAALPAAAQGIYRCGNNYSQQPCPGASQLESPPPAPSAQAQAQSREATQRDARAADAMEKARLKEEAKPVSTYIPASRTEEPAAPEKPVAAKAKKPQYFTAVQPGDKKSKKKDAKKD